MPCARDLHLVAADEFGNRSTGRSTCHIEGVAAVVNLNAVELVFKSTKASARRHDTGSWAGRYRFCFGAERATARRVGMQEFIEGSDTVVTGCRRKELHLPHGLHTRSGV